MKKYNAREKKIIKELVEYKSNFQDLTTLGVFLSKKVFPEDVHLITNVNATNLLYCKEKKKREVIYFIAEISLLMHNLIKDGLLKPIPGGDASTSYVGRIDGFDLKAVNNNK